MLKAFALLTFLTALEAPLLPPAPPGPPPGTPWQRVQDAYARTMAAPVEDARYFQAFLQFTPEELLRALDQGIEQARAYRANDPEEVADRYVLENVRICLEFYPLAATSEQDFTVFLDHIEQQRRDPVYREFLLQRLVPGMAPKSLFADYLTAGARRNMTNLSSRLNRLSYNKTERERIQYTAMQALYQLHLDDLVQVLRSDPALTAEIDDDTPPLAEFFTPELRARLNERTRRTLDRKKIEFQRILGVLSNHVTPENDSSSRLRAKALEILQEMRTRAILQNPEELESLLKRVEAADPGQPATQK